MRYKVRWGSGRIPQSVWIKMGQKCNMGFGRVTKIYRRRWDGHRKDEVRVPTLSSFSWQVKIHFELGSLPQDKKNPRGIVRR